MSGEHWMGSYQPISPLAICSHTKLIMWLILHKAFVIFNGTQCTYVILTNTMRKYTSD